MKAPTASAAVWLIALFTAAQIVILFVCGYTPYPDSNGYISLAADCVSMGDAYPVASLINEYPFLWNLGCINAAACSLALTGSYFPLLFVYCLMKGCTAFFLYKIAEHLINQPVAIIALILYILYPANYGEGTSALSELPFMFFSMAGLYLAIAKNHIVSGGLLLAVANYFRPMAIVFVAAMIVYFLKEWRKSAQLVAGYVAMICIIGACHKVQSGLFLYQAKTGWMSIMDYSTGCDPNSLAVREHNEWNVAQKDSVWRSMFIDWLVAHPKEYVAQMPEKIVKTYVSDNVNMCTFLPDKSERVYMYEELSMHTLLQKFPHFTAVQWLTVFNLLFYYALLITALVSLRFYRHSTHTLSVAVVVIGTIVLLLVGHGEARFHIPFMPFIIIMAATVIDKYNCSRQLRKSEKSKE
jgi:hypothetical protein